MPVIFVNQTGANTELIFDGASMAINPEGKPVHQMPFFEEAVETFSIDELICKPANAEVQCADPVALIHKALVTGIRDYFRKMNFKTAVLGLSGGIDSAVSLCLVAEALGSENTTALLLPSRYSSGHSISDSVKLARTLGVRYEIISIEKTFTVLEDTLSRLFAGKESDVTEENIQARIRATVLMALANKFGSMLLATGNKSEIAVGYCTLYGDMAGGLAVIADLPKGMVYRVARWLNARRPVIPQRVLEKPPSAELRPGQVDQETLPPYDLLDAILERWIDRLESPDDIIAAGYPPETVRKVVRMVELAEFKRRQAPPGIRVTGRAFGTDWQMPIAAGRWWL